MTKSKDKQEKKKKTAKPKKPVIFCASDETVIDDAKRGKVPVRDDTKCVTVIDNTSEAPTQKGLPEDNGVPSAKAALEALSDEQRATMLKEMGFTQRKPREPQGPDPRELFKAATEKLCLEAAPNVCALLNEFPGPVSVTFERDPAGMFSANVKRVRNKYGPRSKGAE